MGNVLPEIDDVVDWVEDWVVDGVDNVADEVDGNGGVDGFIPKNKFIAQNTSFVRIIRIFFRELVVLFLTQIIQGFWMLLECGGEG